MDETEVDGQDFLKPLEEPCAKTGSQVHAHGLPHTHPTCFQPKMEKFQAAIRPNLAYNDLVKAHGAIRRSPALAAGLESKTFRDAK